MSYVKGREINLYVHDGSDFKPMGCALEMSFNLTQELIPITTADSGVEDDFDPGAEGMTVDASGVMTLDQPTKYQFRDFVTNRRSRQRILIEIVDVNGNEYTMDMWVLLQTINATGNVNDFGLYDVSMVRCGAMTEDFTPGSGGGGAGIGSMMIGSTFIIG